MAAEQVEVAVVQLYSGRLRESSTNDPDPDCSNSRNLRTHILRLLGPKTIHIRLLGYVDAQGTRVLCLSSKAPADPDLHGFTALGRV